VRVFRRELPDFQLPHYYFGVHLIYAHFDFPL